MPPRFDVLTLHPEMLRGPFEHSILGRAVKAEWLELGVHDIRDHAPGKHRQVDDTPYGGGAGMVMKVDVVANALEAIRREDSYVVLTVPGGTPFTQSVAQRLTEHQHIIIVCGHYEGIDSRIEALVDEEISLGDFVLTGGEIVAAAIVDATARLHDGVLGNAVSAMDESFSNGLLEYPQFTRPAQWRGHNIPEILLSGHHKNIDAWRLNQSMERTRTRRPDLWRLWTEAHPGWDDPPKRKKRRRRRRIVDESNTTE